MRNARGLTIVEFSSPKQTDTTQRWKIGLRQSDVGDPFRTKIEFSRHDEIEGARFEATEPEVLRPYGLPPFLTTHYATEMAIVQKIQALAGRTEPQARDVFDLNLLLARTEARPHLRGGAKKERLAAAIDHAMSLSFDDYRSQVIAFLAPEQAELYAGRAAWEAMQATVVGRLEAQ